MRIIDFRILKNRTSLILLRIKTFFITLLIEMCYINVIHNLVHLSKQLFIFKTTILKPGKTKSANLFLFLLTKNRMFQYVSIVIKDLSICFIWILTVHQVFDSFFFFKAKQSNYGCFGKNESKLINRIHFLTKRAI